ncbi:hypothetical protein BGZ68_000231 [Mortierella alpina]|nr:hypothetical protein BGZ68_000231 [Mortierella alpina]
MFSGYMDGSEPPAACAACRARGVQFGARVRGLQAEKSMLWSRVQLEPVIESYESAAVVKDERSKLVDSGCAGGILMSQMGSLAGRCRQHVCVDWPVAEWVNAVMLRWISIEPADVAVKEAFALVRDTADMVAVDDSGKVCQALGDLLGGCLLVAERLERLEVGRTGDGSGLADAKALAAEARPGVGGHLERWGRLITGIELDPPLLSLIPLYGYAVAVLLDAPKAPKEVYAAPVLTGSDWGLWDQGDTQPESSGYRNTCAMIARAVAALDDVDVQDIGKSLPIIAFIDRTSHLSKVHEERPTAQEVKIATTMSVDEILLFRAVDSTAVGYLPAGMPLVFDDSMVAGLIMSGLINDFYDLANDVVSGERKNALRLFPWADDYDACLAQMSGIVQAMIVEIRELRGTHGGHVHPGAGLAVASFAYSLSRSKERGVCAAVRKAVKIWPDILSTYCKLRTLALTKASRSCGLRADIQNAFAVTVHMDHKNRVYKSVRDAVYGDGASTAAWPATESGDQALSNIWDGLLNGQESTDALDVEVDARIEALVEGNSASDTLDGAVRKLMVSCVSDSVLVYAAIAVHLLVTRSQGGEVAEP